MDFSGCANAVALRMVRTEWIFDHSEYSKTCVKRPLKNTQNKDLMTNGSLMKAKSIKECSPWSILQYF